MAREIGSELRTAGSILSCSMNFTAYGSISGEGTKVPARISSAPGSSAR
jgi:hypothetical protein